MPDFSEVPPERKPPRGTEETDFPVPAQPAPLEKGISGRERVITIVTAAIVAAFVTIILVFGLQVLLKTASPATTLKQTGSSSVPANEMVEVYNQRPYVTTPNVKVTGPFSEYVLIVEQTPTHFKVKNNSTLPRSFSWDAEGQAQ